MLVGIVDPYFYRMAFPLKVSLTDTLQVSSKISIARSAHILSISLFASLSCKITRWWEEKVLGNFFFCFDGCAQYLTSPTAPYLIASAYQGSRSPPVLVACVRDPVEQAISWWRYENTAISWGETIGLKEWNTDLRSNQYPPKSISDAIRFSESGVVKSAYSNAEQLVQYLVQHHYNGNSFESTRPLFKLFNLKCLPSWALTWPAGQLSTIGRSGNYAQNIERYNKVFSKAFEEKFDVTSYRGESTGASSTHEIPNNTNDTCHTTAKIKIGSVHTIPIECQSNGRALKSAMRPFLCDVVRRSAHRRKLSYTPLMTSMDNAIDKLCLINRFETTQRRNLGKSLSNLELEPTQKDLAMLKGHFEKETAWYSSHGK